MRIVCAVCGEEPVRGQRHFCKPTEAPRAKDELDVGSIAPGYPFGNSASVLGAQSNPYCQSFSSTKVHSSNGGSEHVSALQRRGAANASSGVVCASIASLLSKSPALWKSSRALARCGRDEFAAGLFAVAVGVPGWHKDPKKAILCALARVADDAARALQGFWRRCLSTRASKQRARMVLPGGYQRLALPASQQSGSDVRCKPPTVAGQPGRGRAGVPSAPPSPRPPETPRNKSNPRPTGIGAVPMNPIQALKQRKLQQQQESEERRLLQVQEAEERRAARKREGSLRGSTVSREPAYEALTDAAPPRSPSEAGNSAEADQGIALTPRGDARDNDRMLPTTASPSPRHSLQTMSCSSLPPRPDAEMMSAPVTTSRWRSEHATTPDGPRASSTGKSPSATERLQARMKQRDQNRSIDSRSTCVSSDAPPSWKDRIEARQRETEEMQEMEMEHKIKVTERSCRRNDAMKRVMERQAQRQQEVSELDT